LSQINAGAGIGASFGRIEGSFPMRKLSDLVRDRNPLLLQPELSVRDAAKRMRDDRAGAALIVAADGTLRGIFTRGDAIRRVLAESRDPSATRLDEVMTAELRTVSPRTNVIEALRVMQDLGCRHLPVVDEDRRVVGLVFRGDFRGRELDRIEEEEDLWERI
jgi:CBS domain-containing protein